MKILIVDDMPSNLSLLRTLLEADRHAVFSAADGVEAMELLAREPVDAIISDALMPRMDGYQLCSQVRQNPQYHLLPFIIYTATNTSPADEKLSLDLGADKYIRKPAPPRVLLDALRELMTDEKYKRARVPRGTSSVTPLQARGPLSGRILLAEDDADNQQLLSHYLQAAGAEVTVAKNGQIAFDLVSESMRSLETLGFDLILMDVQMPVMNGHEATAKLRGAGCTIPIIALTATALDDGLQDFVANGFTDFISKPVRRGDLLKLIEQHLHTLAPLGPLSASERKLASISDEALDDVVRACIPEFVAHLPSQVHQLKVLLEARKMEELAKVLHNLKGTGGMYGFPSLTEAAGRAEMTIRRQAPLETIEAEVESALQQIRSVENYDATKE